MLLTSISPKRSIGFETNNKVCPLSGRIRKRQQAGPVRSSSSKGDAARKAMIGKSAGGHSRFSDLADFALNMAVLQTQMSPETGAEEGFLTCLPSVATTD